jgi:quercetin dioxygenase-like cupin family protein
METHDLSALETVEAVEGVHLAQMSVADAMSVQHFHIEPGALVPTHDHHHEQAGFIYEGSLTFVVDGEEFVVSRGESYTIPGGEPHAAENRGDVAVQGIDVFSPPRENPDWME